ncbi:hypothetical protein [Rathayibacter sp. VKM Ac-2630]|uniref:hypothetical protein n=1 Tax=Rathayibacter sp. VKM Ac-2630 TaxID=1938617 RepID=UPI00098103E7|nr:hypothetical protein [Rathayibacter sp. VKM Ac-2630]OOB91765.1 hypothetical protein B0T42_04130 [Rathayibacter sp. VKM Ac-2630]
MRSGRSARLLPCLLRALLPALLVLVVVSALVVQALAGFQPLTNVLGMCARPVEVPVDTYWYAGVVLVMAAGVLVASRLNRAGSGVLAGTLLAVGVVSAALCTFAAFLGTAVWQWGHEDSIEPPSAAEAWGQFGVNVAAAGTPAYALMLSAVLMLVRRKGVLLSWTVPPAAFLAFVLASTAFQVARAWAVCSAA